ncbi:hypothetical protein [Pseudomonas sp. F01002]|uniref:hypothetical protein n=1 Tax=Pseudomonas sp. F01002 TaxID=2555724 RepID=UPI001068E8BD|nr:hypothetical protein [Pseudomonas sp. F01002]TFB44920.1 hypothetical protein E3W21_00955 [Pseudomonas sp. F01002]
MSLCGSLSTLQQHAMAKYVNPEIAQRLKHGAILSNPAAPQVYNGGIETHSTLFEIALESIITHDITILEKCFSSFQEDMGAQFARMIYASVSKVCDQSGNVVDAKKSGSLQLAFLEMLEKIEFSADKTGEVKLPEIHLGTDSFNEFARTMQESTPEYDALVEDIKARKVAEALDREVERKAKFVRYGESEQ